MIAPAGVTRRPPVVLNDKHLTTDRQAWEGKGMTKLNTLHVTGITGAPLTVIHIPPGAWAAFPAAASDKPQVEFYDTRYGHTIFGQFTGGRYNVDTIINDIDDTHGLMLYGGERDWAVSAAELNRIKTWLKEI